MFQILLKISGYAMNFGFVNFLIWEKVLKIREIIICEAFDFASFF